MSGCKFDFHHSEWWINFIRLWWHLLSMKNSEKALKKLKEALEECGLEEKEVEALMNFLKNYLKLKVRKKC